MHIQNKKKLYLHIGTEKTGTTTIQKYLKENAENLLKQGYLYPLSITSGLGNQEQIACYAMNKNKKQEIRYYNNIKNIDDVLKFRKTFRQKLEMEIERFNGQTVILSNEHCSSRLNEIQEIYRLKELLDLFFYKIYIIVYIREQTNMLASSYSTSIKAGSVNKIQKPDEFSNNRFYDFNAMLIKWEEVFGVENINLNIFEKNELENNDIVYDFCKKLNIPTFDYTPILSNKLLNLKQAEFLRRLNRYVPPIINNEENVNRRWIVQLISSIEVESPSLKSLVNQDYCNKFEDSNEEIKNKYFPERERLFSTNKVQTKIITIQEEVLTEQDIEYFFNKILSQKKSKRNDLYNNLVNAYNEISSKNVRTIYLHVGIHKTATSSIQETCYKNRDILKQKDYFYSSTWAVNHGHIFCTIFKDKPEFFHTNIRNKRTKEDICKAKKEYKKTIIQEINETKSKAIIFSGEDIHTLSYSNLEYLKKWLLDEFPLVTIKIIISVRESYAYLNSWIQELNKLGRKMSLNDYEEIIENLYQSKINKLIKVFGKENISIYKFEDACKHQHGPVGYFLNTIGIEDLSDIEFIKTNESVSDKAIQLLTYINQRIPKIINHEMAKGRNVKDAYALHQISGRKAQLNKVILQELESKEIEDKKWLKNEFGIDYLNNKYEYRETSMIYDQKYYNELIDALNGCSDVIKYLVYEFLNKRQNEINTEQGKEIIHALIKYMQDTYAEIVNVSDLETMVDIQEKKWKMQENSKNQFLKHFEASSDVTIPDFYRELAVFCEKHNQIETALYFMTIAKQNRPNGPFINQKSQQYINKLKDEQ